MESKKVFTVLHLNKRCFFQRYLRYLLDTTQVATLRMLGKQRISQKGAIWLSCVRIVMSRLAINDHFSDKCLASEHLKCFCTNQVALYPRPLIKGSTDYSYLRGFVAMQIYRDLSSCCRDFPQKIVHEMYILWGGVILLMDKILQHQGWWLSHCL